MDKIILEISSEIRQSQLLTSSINEVLKHIMPMLKLNEVKIEVRQNELETIPEFGVGGYCGNTSTIEIAVAPERESDWSKSLPRIIAHECHHLARSRGPGYGTSLAETFVSEGLAQHFEIEAYPGMPSFYSQFLSEAEQQKWIQVFRDELQCNNFSYQRWFFGGNEIPFHAGYDLSFYLVGLYLRKANRRASQEINLNSGDFLRIFDEVRERL